MIDLKTLQSEVDHARLARLDAQAAGTEVEELIWSVQHFEPGALATVKIEQRARAYELFSRQFEVVAAWARQQEPELAPLHPRAARFLVWSITELVTAEVAADRGGSLLALEDEVVWLIGRLLAEPG